MKKTMKGLVAGLLVMVAMTGCGEKNDGEAKVKSTTLRVAFNQSENHPQYKALENFSNKLEEETNGAYKLDISPNSLLGDQRAATELVQNGVIQMAVIGNPVVENFNKDFAVIGLPYIYESLDHQKDVFLSGVLDDLYTSVESSGFKVVGAFTAGARSVYTDKPIEKPEDLAGYKVRVMQSDTMKRMFDYMGGVGTPMAQGEVYTAIQQGVLEGGENNEVTYVDLKHYEVAPYFSYTNHLMVPDLIVINNKAYDGMSEENKEIFNTLMDETVKFEFDEWNKEIKSAKETAIENGATFVELDMAPFQERVSPLQEAVVESSEMTKEVYDAIKELAKK